MTRYVSQQVTTPLHTNSYKNQNTLHVYFRTQTHLHIPTYFITTSNNTRYKNQNTESSPQSSLPCGQQTPTSSTNTSDTFVPRPTSTFQPISSQQVTTPDTKIKIQNLHPKVHYPVDNRHLQAQPTLQTHHLRIHLHSRLYIHNHNHLLPHKCITHHQNPINHKINNLYLLRPMLTHLPSLPFQM